MVLHSHYIVNFSKLDKSNLDLIGKKAHQIHELINLGIPIPDGFIIKTCSHVSDDLIREIHKEYKKLCGLFTEASLTIYASFLNNKVLTFSNVKGDANLIHHIKKILKSPGEKPVNIIVQKNIQSKIKGKIFTKDPHNPNEESILITENNALATYNISSDFQITYKHFAHLTKKSYILEHQNVIDLALTGKKLQEHFYFPQEIDFTIKDGKNFITDVKPLTHVYLKDEVATQKKLEKQETKGAKKPILKGISIYPGVATGVVKVIHQIRELDHIMPSDVIVISHLYPSLYKKLKKAKGVVSNVSLQKDKDKMFYRNLVSIPTISGAEGATKILQNGNIVTINGTIGEIYSGGMN